MDHSRTASAARASVSCDESWMSGAPIVFGYAAGVAVDHAARLDAVGPLHRREVAEDLERALVHAHLPGPEGEVDVRHEAVHRAVVDGVDGVDAGARAEQEAADGQLDGEHVVLGLGRGRGPTLPLLLAEVAGEAAAPPPPVGAEGGLGG